MKILLAAALSDEWRVLARRGWVGEKAAFLSILLSSRFSACNKCLLTRLALFLP